MEQLSRAAGSLLGQQEIGAHTNDSQELGPDKERPGGRPGRFTHFAEADLGSRWSASVVCTSLNVSESPAVSIGVGEGSRLDRSLGSQAPLFYPEPGCEEARAEDAENAEPHRDLVAALPVFRSLGGFL